jgi:hypothetical protein
MAVMLASSAQKAKQHRLYRQEKVHKNKADSRLSTKTL